MTTLYSLIKLWASSASSSELASIKTILDTELSKVNIETETLKILQVDGYVYACKFVKSINNYSLHQAIEYVKELKLMHKL